MKRESEAADVVSKAAAVWLARYDRGLTAEEEREFTAWRNSSPQNQAEWTSMASTWKSLDTTSAVADLIAEASAVERRTWRTDRPTMLRWALSGLAAAAVLAIGFFLGRQAPTVNKAPLEPAVAMIAAEVKRITLPDGSVIESRGDSEVKVEFSDVERRVRLNKGEAFFTVGHDSSRPFFVEADGVVVRAVGTAFNVRRDSGRIDVMVTEGRVRLETPTEAAIKIEAKAAPQVSAGIGASISNNANALAVETRQLSPAELDAALAWRSPLVEFSHASLNEVLDTFRQHSPLHVRLGDPELGKRRISGTFQANNIEGFLRFGESMLGLRVERTSNGEVILHTSTRVPFVDDGI